MSFQLTENQKHYVNAAARVNVGTVGHVENKPSVLSVSVKKALSVGLSYTGNPANSLTKRSNWE